MAKITSLDAGEWKSNHQGHADDDTDAYSTMTEDNANHNADVDDDILEDDEPIYSNGGISSESFLYRLGMLRGMIPLHIRVFWYKWFIRTTIWAPWIAKKVGNTFWILITSAFLVGFPIFYEGERDKQLRLMEKEQRLIMPGAAPESKM